MPRGRPVIVGRPDPTMAIPCAVIHCNETAAVSRAKAQFPHLPFAARRKMARRTNRPMEDSIESISGFHCEPWLFDARSFQGAFDPDGWRGAAWAAGRRGLLGRGA